MKIKEIIEELNGSNNIGFQVEKINGILTSTWLIYKHEEFYFYFDINQNIEFIERYKYSEEELMDEFKNANFKIDLSIS